MVTGERIGFCRAKWEVCAVSFPSGVKASIPGLGISFNSVLLTTLEQGYLKRNGKAQTPKW